MHLLIPFAGTTAPGCAQAALTLQLPHLEQLLRHLSLSATDTGEATSMTPPHERALALHYGLTAPDGCIGWAARDAPSPNLASANGAWAWITPVHWDVGADHITMADPDSLDLQEAESRELLSAMAPFFSGDGIALQYGTAQRWRAHGEIFRDLSSASLDRVAGREISAWMPTSATLRRLQNEMQMLLYTHTVNDARAARGLATVNSFWVSGTGRWPAALAPVVKDLMLPDTLRRSALREDWVAWSRNWAQVDRTECLQLLEAMRSGTPVQLTLCGERNTLRFEAAQDGVLQQLRRRFTRTTLSSLQNQL